MIKSKHTFSLLLCMLFALTMQAQLDTARYDVRFGNQSIDCETSSMLIDVEVKAANTDPGFFMSEQNYRFSYNRDALGNPAIITQELTGFKPGGPGQLGFTLYSPHNLIGSLDTVVSYNVELQGGDGTFLTNDTWILVGQLGFDVLDPNACFDLTWHETRFPPTFVGEYVAGERFDAAGTLYSGTSDCAGCLLPMEIIKFDGAANNCAIHLFWETASETNTSHVVIQRSANGVNFQDIGRVNAAGNSEVLQSYSYTDATVIVANNYYRLKSVDTDGSHRYSEMIEVKTNCFRDNGTDILDVYPNPVRESNLNIRLYADTNEAVDISIMDISGKIVVQNNTALHEGINTLQVPVKHLSAGTYFVSVQGGNWHATAQKFVKINE